MVVLFEVGQNSPRDEETSGMPGGIEAAIDNDGSRGGSSGAPSKLPSGEASTTSGPRGVTATSMAANWAPLASASTQPGPMAVTWGVGLWGTSTAQAAQGGFRLWRKGLSGIRFPERAANPRAAGRGISRGRCGGKGRGRI